MATQNFKINLLLNLLYREREKNLTFVSSCHLRERYKCLTLAAYFLHLETPGLPACDPPKSTHTGTQTQTPELAHS